MACGPTVSVACARVSRGTTGPPPVAPVAVVSPPSGLGGAEVAGLAAETPVLLVPVDNEAALEVEPGTALVGVALKYRSDSVAGSRWYWGSSSSSTLYSLADP